MTNYEKVKNMSIEEMALNIMCPAEYDLNFSKNECYGQMNQDCYRCTLDWLNKEVGE